MAASSDFARQQRRARNAIADLAVLALFMLALCVSPGLSAAGEVSTELREWSPNAPLPAISFWIDDNGPFTAIVDTGNGTTGFAISATLAQRLALPATEATADSATRGVGGAADLRFVRARSVRLAGVELRDIPVGVSGAFDRLAKVVGAPMDGNLGYGVLSRYRVQLNWRLKEFKLTPSVANETQGASFSIARSKPLIVTAVQVARGKQASAVFDTGASMNLVSPKLAVALGLALGDEVDINGVGGAARGRVSTLRSVQVGGATVGPIDVVVSDAVDQIADIAGVPVDMLLGPDAVGERELVIDYPARKIVIR